MKTNDIISELWIVTVSDARHDEMVKEVTVIGDKVILGNDTLIVTKIELFDKTYLHNGAIIDTNFAIECLEK